MSYARVQTFERKVDYTKKMALVKTKPAFFHHSSKFYITKKGRPLTLCDFLVYYVYCSYQIYKRGDIYEPNGYA